MTKLALFLLLVSTTAVLWRNVEAKPFFSALPPAPSADSVASSSLPSSPNGLDLLAAIISKKISFVTNLLAGGAAGGNTLRGLGGASGGGLASSSPTGGFEIPPAVISKKIGFITNLLYGLAGDAGGSVASPSVASSPNIELQIPLAIIQKKIAIIKSLLPLLAGAAGGGAGSCVDSTIGGSAGGGLGAAVGGTTTISTDTSSTDKEAEATTTTTAVTNNEKDSSTQQITVDVTVDTTTMISKHNEPITTAATAMSTTEMYTTEMYTTEMFTTEISTTKTVKSTTTKQPIKTENNVTPITTTTVTTEITEPSIDFSVHPTVAIPETVIVTTESNFISRAPHKTTLSLFGTNHTPNTNAVSGGFEILTVGGGRDDIEKAATVTINAGGSEGGIASSFAGAVASGYDYHKNEGGIGA